MNEVIAQREGSYRVNLPMFEGPLDLLLYLIRKHDLDVSDIPIATLAGAYLEFIATMESLDIDLAGEFLMMAAELMYIKSQMLLPISPSIDEDENDPRADLVRKLMEYQRFKAAAQTLGNREILQRDNFRSLAAVNVENEKVSEIRPTLTGCTVYNLMGAFDRVLKKVPRELYHEVVLDRLSVNDRIYEIAEFLSPERPLAIESLLPDPLTRYDIVVTFLALLEMSRLRMVSLFQAGKDETLYVQQLVKIDLAETNLERGDDGTSGIESYR